MSTKSFSASCVMLAVLSISLPGQAVEPPSQAMLAFCSTVRDDYIATTKKRYESQRYQGNGSAGAGISFGKGINFGGDGSYDWQRTWNNLDTSTKRNYASKNCDSVLQQWGQVSVAEIQADAQTAIARMKLEADKYSADTQATIAGINLEAIKNTNASNVEVTNINAKAQARIEELKQAGRIREAQIIAETLKHKVEAEQSGQTERVKIETQALVTMTQANTAAEVEKAKITAATQKHQSGNQLVGGIVGALGNVIRSSITSSGSRNQQKVAAEVERERIQAQLVIAKLNAETERLKIAAANAGTNAAGKLLSEWGWTKVTCYLGAVFITDLSNDAVCVNPSAAIAAGQYRYDRAANQLIPLTPTTVSIPTQPDPLSVPVQTTASPDSSGF